MEDELKKARKLATLSWFHSLIDEADRRGVEKVKIYYEDLERRADAAVGFELFKAELLKLIKEEV